MPTVLLAVDDRTLLSPCRRLLEQRGYLTIPAGRALAVLSLASLVRWDVAVLDSSDVGRGALEALSLLPQAPLIGIGIQDARLARSLPLPLVAESLLASLDAITRTEGAPERSGLRLDPLKRIASFGGREVSLTRTEFRLLQLLYERRPAEVSLSEILLSVWGSTEGLGTSDMVRSHLRNLRRKLQSLELDDALRSRRGRGYALVL
jgi:two-component system response regulator MprA